MSIYSETSIKTKTIKIKNFELFYVEGYDKPFVKPNKNNKSFIFARLYLLTLKEINKILNFINRIEDKTNSLSNEKLLAFFMIFLLCIYIPDVGLICCAAKDILDCFK